MWRKSEPIDFSRLDELSGIDDDGSLVEQLISMFIDSVPERIAALHAACAGEDRRALAHAAHALRGSASSIGANELAKICRVIEHHAGTGDPLHGVGAELARLDAAGTGTINALRAYQSGRAAPPGSAG